MSDDKKGTTDTKPLATDDDITRKSDNDDSIDIIDDDSIELKTIEEKKEETTEDTSEYREKPVLSLDDLKQSLLEEKEKSKNYKDQLKIALADYQNLKRRVQSDIENEVNNKFDKFMLDYLQIHDDFMRARDAYLEEGIDVKGLESIIKNMDSLLSKYHILPILTLGEFFDPKLHEAISVIEDFNLDENTITKEIRKGYVSNDRVIRPALVEIAKKSIR